MRQWWRSGQLACLYAHLHMLSDANNHPHWIIFFTREVVCSIPNQVNYSLSLGVNEANKDANYICKELGLKHFQL